MSNDCDALVFGQYHPTSKTVKYQMLRKVYSVDYSTSSFFYFENNPYVYTGSDHRAGREPVPGNVLAVEGLFDHAVGRVQFCAGSPPRRCSLPSYGFESNSRAGDSDVTIVGAKDGTKYFRIQFESNATIGHDANQYQVKPIESKLYAYLFVTRSRGVNVGQLLDVGKIEPHVHLFNCESLEDCSKVDDGGKSGGGSAGGLSKRTKIIIGVCVGVAVVILIVIISLCLCCKDKPSSTSTQEKSKPMTSTDKDVQPKKLTPDKLPTKKLKPLPPKPATVDMPSAVMPSYIPSAV